MQDEKKMPANLTGRIAAGPHTSLDEDILTPQFHYDLAYLLPWYIQIEKVLLLEYRRMDLLNLEEALSIGTILNSIRRDTLQPKREENMSDIAFAIERQVEQSLSHLPGAWHVDRSRNDFQACAQLLSGREQLLAIIDQMVSFAWAVHRRASAMTEMIMPGYTHYQAAQVISPGFYLTALIEEMLASTTALLNIYDGLNTCPLGAGAMAGQQLPWDRVRMASLLGFDRPQRHALVSVASRDWRTRIAAELSTIGATLSRFITDLIAWGSGPYAFISLPDEFSGISSAMPQKKNFPVLERLRARTAHLTAYYQDFIMGQRNTSYTNLVEVSKEAGSQLSSMFTTMASLLRIFTLVIDQMEFQSETMRHACTQEYFGGFALANHLTLQAGISTRQGQVAAGKYIVQAIQQGFTPGQGSAHLLHAICQAQGYSADIAYHTLQELFDPEHNLQEKHTSGSTGTQAVEQMLREQTNDLQHVQTVRQSKQFQIEQALREIDRQLSGEKEVEDL
ncbi:argininosuccinate lyase [Ktedonosporobacter rubrisoli]|uniref:argininosuccinate lyase n=2 Tax=Ktedonosporobacter rubrisoli TaxID=2509675 RepID=A0A4P6K659_KTERU|nr:argininosuccinate lyase [Ktedonosporobacter rubrisoli]